MLLATMLVTFAVIHSAAASPFQHNNATSKVVASYGDLPLSFEANYGQTSEQVRFLSRGQGYGLFLTPDEAVLALSKPGAEPRDDTEANNAVKQSVLRMQLLGANPATQVTGRDALRAKSNYFIGKDPKAWRSNVPHYCKVHYQGVYPGIDLVFYGTNAGQLEYDFVVAPGADPNNIALGIEGADQLEIDANGDLVLHVAGGEVRLRKPFVYQEIDGERQAIAGQYTLKGGRVGFQLAAYDADRPLVIDPVLAYSTYLGGNSQDLAYGIAVDGDGNAYVTGHTLSPDFPTTGALQPAIGGSFDAFVAKLNASGTALVYSTFLGGTGIDRGIGITVDSSGNAFVAGRTVSSNFPTTTGAYEETYPGSTDGFVAKLNPGGSALVYSTYLGGSGNTDIARAIAVDGSGNAYVTGRASSGSFPTVNAYDTSRNGNSDAFVAKLNTDGSDLLYSTYLGGDDTSFEEEGHGIAVDNTGKVYIAGMVHSGGLATAGAYDTTYNGGDGDAFVAKFDPAQTTTATLVYFTYLGDIDVEVGRDIAVDGSGNAHVTGDTFSVDFPTTGGAYQETSGGSWDAYITKLNASGSGLLYSTFLGGSGTDRGYSIKLDGSGNAFVTGDTASSNFPTTVDALQSSNAGGSDAFVAKLNADGSGLLYSTFHGGESLDFGQGIAVNGDGNAYIAGYTTSQKTFPTTRGAFKSRFDRGDTYDGFVAKIVLDEPADVGVAGGGFNTRGRVDLSRCGSPCSENVKIKVKNYGDTTTAVAYAVASNAPGVAAPNGCAGTTSVLPPRGTQTVTGCTVEYSEPGIFALTLTVSPTLGTDIDLSNNEAVKKVKVVE
jgi:hypothetical protein